MRKVRHRIGLLLLPIGFVAVLLWLMGSWLNRPVLGQTLAQSGAIIVSQAGDSGPGSLRAAILEANGQPGVDQINIAVSDTLLLLSPLPEITDAVTISGPGASLFRIDGGSAHQLLKFASTTITITGVTLQRGANLATGGRGGAVQGVGTLHLHQTHILSNSAQSHGGALHVLGTLTLDQVVVRYNHSETATGGAAFVSGTTIISDSQFFENYAGHHGGVIYSLGTMSIANSDFGDNYCLSGGCRGGALHGFPETTVDQVTLIDNVAGYNGGAANLLGVLTMTNSLLQHNRTLNSNGGALFGQDYAYISHSQFLDNAAQHQGGGMYMLGDLTLVDSTFIGNEGGHHGGGLIVYGSLAISRSQFIRNEGLRGGGLYHQLAADGVVTNNFFLDNAATTGEGQALYLGAGGTVDLAHLTIASQSSRPGAAIAVVSGTVQLRNSIVTSHAIGLSNTLGLVSEDYNLFYANGVDSAGPVGAGGHSFVDDPRFQDLGTANFHLQTGSPAIDAALDLGLDSDLDGEPRPLLAGVDIGADEANPITGLAFTYTPGPVTIAGLRTTFSATVVTGWGVTYEWQFNDGTGPLAGNPLAHAFADEAVYTVILTARNSSGMVQVSRPVTVVAGLGTIYLPLVRRR